VRSARFAVGLLLAINLFNYIDRYVLAAVESRIAGSLLKGDPNALAKMGSLATAFILSYMITAPIFGILADRMSRWLLVAIGVVLWSVASGASGLAPTFALLLITRLFVGVGEAGYGPAAPTLIADLYPVEKRGQVLAWFYMAIPVGSGLGYAWGGGFEWLAQRLGVSPENAWRWPFYGVVLPGLILGLFAFRMREPRRDTAPDAPAKQHAKFSDYVQLLKTPSYVLDCLGMTAMTFAIGGIAFWMPRYIAEVRGAGSLSSVNMIFSILTGVAGITATLLGGIAGDKLRPHYGGAYFLVSAVGIFLAAPAILAMLWLPFPFAWVAIFVAEFFLFFNTGPSNTILANVTHPSVRATAFALNIFVIHALGDAISPPVLGAAAERMSWNFAFGLVVATVFMAAGFWMLGARYLQRDTERVSPSPAANATEGRDVRVIPSGSDVVA
jgi:MFS family permease